MTMMPIVVEVPGNHLVELALADEGLRRGQPLFDLEPFLREDDRRMREPAVLEARRAGNAVHAGKAGAADWPWS